MGMANSISPKLAIEHSGKQLHALLKDHFGGIISQPTSWNLENSLAVFSQRGRRWQPFPRELYCFEALYRPQTNTGSYLHFTVAKKLSEPVYEQAVGLIQTAAEDLRIASPSTLSVYGKTSSILVCNPHQEEDIFLARPESNGVVRFGAITIRLTTPENVMDAPRGYRLDDGRFVQTSGDWN
jgi:hypothetical protein